MNKRLIILFISACVASCNIVFHKGTRNAPLRGCVPDTPLTITEYEPSFNVIIYARIDSTGASLSEDNLMADLRYTKDSLQGNLHTLKKNLTSLLLYPEYEKDMGITGEVHLSARLLPDGSLQEPELVKSRAGVIDAEKSVADARRLEKEASRALKAYSQGLRVQQPKDVHALIFSIRFQLKKKE